MLWQLIEVFGASHSARYQKRQGQLTDLTHIIPTVCESQELKKFKK
mgnify:CR=1 FL=1